MAFRRGGIGRAVLADLRHDAEGARRDAGPTGMIDRMANERAASRADLRSRPVLAPSAMLSGTGLSLGLPLERLGLLLLIGP